MGTSTVIVFDKGFNCPWCGAHQVVNAPVPVDVVIGCGCGKVFKVTVRQATAGVWWTVEQLD